MIGSKASLIFDAKNLAFDKPVETSSGDGEEALVNGSIFDSGWLTDAFSSENCNQWVIIDLEKIYAFNRVNIMPRGDGFPKAFTISVSNDGAKWETVVAYTDYDAVSGAVQEFTFDAVNAQYVKLDASALGQLSNGEYGMQLAELEVYNNAPKERLDIDLDGDVDIADAMKLLNYIANNKTDAPLVDVIRILKHIAK